MRTNSLAGAPEEIRTPDPQIRSLALFQRAISQLFPLHADPIETWRVLPNCSTASRAMACASLSRRRGYPATSSVGDRALGRAADPLHGVPMRTATNA